VISAFGPKQTQHVAGMMNEPLALAAAAPFLTHRRNAQPADQDKEGAKKAKK
jgi:hypothetical protein